MSGDGRDRQGRSGNGQRGPAGAAGAPWDAIVVGAGLADMAAAYTLARGGARVLVL